MCGGKADKITFECKVADFTAFIKPRIGKYERFCGNPEINNKPTRVMNSIDKAVFYEILSITIIILAITACCLGY